MTEQEIMQKLNLLPWDTFAIQKMRENLRDEYVKRIGTSFAVKEVYRGTGRTTHSAVAAIAASTELGKTICCWNEWQKKAIIGMAKELGIEIKSTIIVLQHNPNLAGVGLFVCDKED